MDKFTSTVGVLMKVGVKGTREMIAMKAVESMECCTIRQIAEYSNKFATNDTGRTGTGPVMKTVEELVIAGIMTMEKKRHNGSKKHFHAELTPKGLEILSVFPCNVHALLRLVEGHMLRLNCILTLWAVYKTQSDNGVNTWEISSYTKHNSSVISHTLRRQGLLEIRCKKLVQYNTMSYFGLSRKGEKAVELIKFLEAGCREGVPA